jgi:hypothetical protein
MRNHRMLHRQSKNENQNRVMQPIGHCSTYTHRYTPHLAMKA